MIQLVYIAKNVSDLEIDGDELEEEISGMQATYKGVSFIRYNINHSTKRNRFTIGKSFLGKQGINELASIGDRAI